MYKISEIELKEIKLSLSTVVELLPFSDELEIKVRKIIKSLEKNYNIK